MKTPDTVYLSPTPDGAHGARVKLPPGTARAVIRGGGLQAVDVEADAGLTELDLTSCGGGLFVTLQGASSIQRICVPPSGKGAVFFMELSELRSPLRIEGAVQALDVTCRDERGRPALVRVDVKDEVFHGAWLGASGAPLDMDAGLVALCGGKVDGGWLSQATSARAVVLSRCAAPQGLTSPCALRQLVLTDVETPSLAFLSTKLVRLERCNTLASISGHAERLVIRDGMKVKELTITGHVGEADVAGAHCKILRIPAVQALVLHSDEVEVLHTLATAETLVTVRGGRAPQVKGRQKLAVRPLTPADIEREFLHGTESGREGMLAWARGCKRNGELWLALQVLTSGIDTGVPASRAWADRCALAPRGGKEHWEWNFPADLAIRGWSADVRLWLRCLAAELPEAAAYARVMCSALEPANFAALLAVAASADMSEDERTLLAEMALRVLEAGTRDGQRLDMKRKKNGTLERVGISAVNVDWLHQAFRALLELSPLPLSVPLADAWAGWLAARAPVPEGVELLGSLAAHGCKRAEDSLVQLQQQLPRRKDLDKKAKAALSRALSLQLLQPARAPRWGGAS